MEGGRPRLAALLGPLSPLDSTLWQDIQSGPDACDTLHAGGCLGPVTVLRGSHLLVPKPHRCSIIHRTLKGEAAESKGPEVQECPAAPLIPASGAGDPGAGLVGLAGP